MEKSISKWKYEPPSVDIELAGEIVESWLKKGRVPVRDVKEKYGTLRVYLDFGWHSLHSFCYPGYMHNQFPKWLWKLDCRFGYLPFKLINLVVIPVHKYLYRKGYQEAVKKYPLRRKEILGCADYPELLEGL